MSEERPFVPKTPIDFQKLKLDRLMANPNKPIVIPDMPKERKGLSVPEFVRNVMGSSAGAGSGEFHVYRHLRRKEYTRQKIIEEKAEHEKLDEDFERKREENKRKMEEKTLKNRAKRLKRKERKKKLAKTGKKVEPKSESEEESDSESCESSNKDSGDECTTNDSKQDLEDSDCKDNENVEKPEDMKESEEKSHSESLESSHKDSATDPSSATNSKQGSGSEDNENVALTDSTEAS